MKVITHKTSYGGKYNTNVRVGHWVLFNVEGAKKAEGDYRYEDEFSNKDGEWNYYSDESVLLFKRWYVKGLIEKTQFLDSGYYAHEGDTVIIVSDTLGAMTIEERKGKINYKYSASERQVLNGPPEKLARTEKAKARETELNRFSDEQILQKYPMINATLNFKSWAVNTPENLINNPDFEMEKNKMLNGHVSVIKPSGEHLAKFWGSANETPDIFYFNDNCFAGYRVYGANYEVLRNELKEPLKAGGKYCLQFKLKLKYENMHAINGVSVTTGKNMLVFRNNMEGYKNGVVLQTHKSLPLACRNRWMTISGSFTAEGGEKYLYIGNFTPDTALRIFSIDGLDNRFLHEIYYYIDDVVLLEQKEGTTYPCNVDGCELHYDISDTMAEEIIVQNDKDNIYTSPKVGQTIVLRNIQFETAKWELLESSFATLDSLLTLMQNYPNMKVEISGHTDNKGKAVDNQLLSFNRAYAVATYLMDYGIDETRITYQGLGQTQPIDTNSTESGRLNNRRVEFKILAL